MKNNIFDDVYKSIKHKLILEQSDEKMQEEEPMTDEQEKISSDYNISNTDATIKFSNNISNEFKDVLNEFSEVCAKMVVNKSVDKDLYEKFNALHKKIKSLVDAAKNF